MSTHHRFHSLGNIPFSWENSPGISKVAPRADDSPTPPCAGGSGVVDPHKPTSKLPPPPSYAGDSPKLFSGSHSLLVPLPPCMFLAPPPAPQQPPPRRSSSKGYWPRREEDPFLAAYKECTKSLGNEGINKKKKQQQKKKRRGWLGFGGSLCKQGSGVRDHESMVASTEPAQISGMSLTRSKSSGMKGKKPLIL